MNRREFTKNSGVMLGLAALPFSFNRREVCSEKPIYSPQQEQEILDQLVVDTLMKYDYAYYLDFCKERRYRILGKIIVDYTKQLKNVVIYSDVDFSMYIDDYTTLKSLQPAKFTAYKLFRYKRGWIKQYPHRNTRPELNADIIITDDNWTYNSLHATEPYNINKKYLHIGENYWINWNISVLRQANTQYSKRGYVKLLTHV